MWLLNINRSQLPRLVLAILFANYCFSNLCSINELKEEVTDTASACNLATKVSCESGFVSVIWKGPVKILETIVIGENTQLSIAGVNNATIDGSGLFQLFSVAMNGRLELRNLKLTDGVERYGGAVHLNMGASLFAEDCEFVSNSAFIAGGAIYISLDAKADIYRSLFYSNRVFLAPNTASHGGAVCIQENSAVNIFGCNFTGNSAVELGDLTDLLLHSPNGASEFYLGTLPIVSSSTDFFAESFWGSSTLPAKYYNSKSFSSTSLYTSSNESYHTAPSNSNDPTYYGSSSLPEYYGINSGWISHGGAIFVLGSKSLSIEESDFEYNSSDEGGAVYISNTENAVVIIASNFVGNTGSQGGALYLDYNSKLRIVSSIFRDHTGFYQGAGIYSDGKLELLNSTGFNNIAPYGAFISSSGKFLTLTDTQAFNNTATGSGGVLEIHYDFTTLPTSLVKTINIKGNEFIENHAKTSGGAIYVEFTNQPTKISITNTTFINCSATESGGAIHSNLHTLLITTNCTFFNNKASIGGGIQSIGNVEINSCKASNNSVATFGGFLYVGYGGKARIYRSIFWGNDAFNGGGIFAQDGSTVKLKDVQFAGNTALQAGAGIFQFSDNFEKLILKNVTFTDSSAYCCYAEGTVTLSSPPYLCADVDFGSGTFQCCPSSQYIGNKFCEICGNEFKCDKTGLVVTTLPLTKGYWREHLGSSNCLKCHKDGACIGGQAKTSDGYCDVGYHGPYCSICNPGYVSAIGHSCLKCDDDSRAITAAVVVIISIILCTIFLLVLASLIEIEHTTEAAKVIQSRLLNDQIRSILMSIPFEKLRGPYVVLTILTQYITITGFQLPALYSTFLQWVDIINFDISWLAATSCTIKIDFYRKLLLSTLIPLGVVAFTGFTYAFNLRRLHAFRMSPRSFAEACEQTRSKHVQVNLIFCFLIYSTVSTVIFQTFACDKLPDSGNKWLRADYSVSCDTEEYSFYKYYAGFMVIVYPIGIPMLFLHLLRKGKSKIQNIRETSLTNIGSDYNLQSTSFLWEKYRRSKWWWEIMECLRRLMLTGFLVFILPGTAGQAAISSLFAAISMLVFGMAQPMIDYHETQMYWLGCFILFGTCLSTLLLKGDYAAEEDQSQTVISISLIILNILLIVTALWQLVTGYRLARKTLTRQISFFGLRPLPQLEGSEDVELTDEPKLRHLSRSD